MTVKRYDLQMAQDFVREAIERSKPRHARWRVLEALYATGDITKAEVIAKDTGKIWDPTQGLDEETVNLVKPHIDVIISSVIAHDPRHLCVPYGGGEAAEEAARLSEAVLRYWWVRSRATQDAKDATWDMVVTGNGFLKVGWRHLEAMQDLEPHEIEEQLADLLDAADREADISGQDPLDTDDLVDALEPTQSIVELDEPFVEYVSPYDIFVPANARRMWETRWVAQRVTLPMDELKENSAFSSSARAKLRPDGVNGRDDIVSEWRRRAEDNKGVLANTDAFETATVFEFYDMRTRRLMVFQADAEQALYDDELPYAHRYPPFAHLRNYSHNGNEFWAFGDLENVANVQYMLNEFFTESIENARRAGNKYLVREESWTQQMQDALESDTPDVVAKVSGDYPIQEMIHSVERKALSGDVYAVKAELEDALRKILGINDFQAGGVGADRMSATAAAVVDGVASLRQQEKIAQVEEGVAQAGQLLLLLCQEFMTEPQAVRIAGAAGAAWVDIDATLIRGEFLVNVEGGSTQAVNPATREQKGMRTLTQVLPVLAQLGFDTTPALRMGLRDLGYDPDQILAPGQQPPLPPGTEEEGIPEDAPAAAVMGAGGPPTAALAQTAGDTAL